MNTRKLLILGAAVVAAIALNLTAGETLLSPRAKDNAPQSVSSKAPSGCPMAAKCSPAGTNSVACPMAKPGCQKAAPACGQK